HQPHVVVVMGERVERARLDGANTEPDVAGGRHAGRRAAGAKRLSAGAGDDCGGRAKGNQTSQREPHPAWFIGSPEARQHDPFWRSADSGRGGDGSHPRPARRARSPAPVTESVGGAWALPGTAAVAAAPSPAPPRHPV